VKEEKCSTDVGIARNTTSGGGGGGWVVGRGGVQGKLIYDLERSRTGTRERKKECQTRCTGKKGIPAEKETRTATKRKSARERGCQEGGKCVQLER